MIGGVSPRTWPDNWEALRYQLPATAEGHYPRPSMDREVEIGVEVLPDFGGDDTGRLRTGMRARDADRIGLGQAAVGTGRP